MNFQIMVCFMDNFSLDGAAVRDSHVDKAYRDLEKISAAPLWKHYNNLFPAEPTSKAIPYIWRFDELRKLLDVFTGVMSLEEAERRVLMMINPNLTDPPATLSTLFAGIQAILPGETARPHRHSSSALRFIIEGKDASTTVNGERVAMNPGDLLLTPGWCWHDHIHRGDAPIYWLDGLDYPFVNAIEGSFFEHYEGGEMQPEIVSPGLSSRLFTHGRLNPVWQKQEGKSSPIGNYSWKQSQTAFEAIGDDVPGSGSDGIMLEYVNPWTGGSVMPTIGCRVARLRKGFAGRARRTTANMIFHIVEGAGRTLTEGKEMKWKKGDTFAVPSWTYYELHNASPTEHASLFSFTDEPMRRSLGLLREELAD